ncbi:hypothetical protein [Micromonospora sp. NPDC003776]
MVPIGTPAAVNPIGKAISGRPRMSKRHRVGLHHHVAHVEQVVEHPFHEQQLGALAGEELVAWHR